MGALVVTGASGWLGGRLVSALAGALPPLAGLAADLRGAEGRAVIRGLVPPGEDAAGGAPRTGARVELVRGDVREPASLTPLFADAAGGVLFHTAGVIHPPGRTRPFGEVNVAGTRHVLEAAVAAGMRRAVVVSSNSPFGANPGPAHRFDESAPYRPYMEYGRSKMRMEQVVAGFREAGRIETVVIRPPWFYGPGQPARQTAFFRMIRRGVFPLVAGGRSRRSLAYVDDLCQGLLRAARTPEAAGRRYWIADAEPYRMCEIVDTVERLLRDELGLPVAGRRLRLPGLASDLARTADRALQAVGLYESRIHVLSEMNLDIACRIDAARRDLGFEPTVGLEEGMRRSLRWCAEHGLPL